jgi:hypothetical protein
VHFPSLSFNTTFILRSNVSLFTLFSTAVNLFLFYFLWYDAAQSGKSVSTSLKNILTVFRVGLLT